MEYQLGLRQLRQEKGFSVERLAHRISCSPHLIGAVEAGVQPIPGHMLITWANTLRVSPEELILFWINQQARKMCLDAGIEPSFKVVPVDEPELVGGNEWGGDQSSDQVSLS